MYGSDSDNERYNRNCDPLSGAFLPRKNLMNDCTGFLIACHKNHIDITRLLLEKYPYVIH